MSTKYPRVKHQVIIRETRIGDYLLSGDSVLKIEDMGRKVVEWCDGSHTVSEIAQWAAEMEGEPVETVRKELEEFLDTLVEEGVITYIDSPEKDPLPAIYQYDRPLSVIWEITYACNQNCKYCIAKAGKPDPHELTEEEINTVLDELVDLRVGLINITGGEPVLKKDTALYIARKASERGIELELLTNAMLMTPDTAQAFSDAGVRHAQVSVDCARPEIHDDQRGIKGSWERAVAGIKNLREAGIEVMAASVMNSETITYFEETRTFLGSIADVLKMGPVMPMGRGENHACLLTPDMYFELLKLRNKTDDNQLTDFIFCKERCSIGTTPVIAPNGNVYPCMLTKYEELKLGNVRESSLRDIYKNSHVLKELFECRVDKIETCRDCWNRYYCGGGCRGCAFAYHQTIYKKDSYQCEARKKFARALLRQGHPSTKKALKELLKLTRKSKEESHG
ncbi:MAG: radical SAM protein [Theionarchaea archaeon]|nr:radical SAM protein [Theionarchaea archaeon]